MLANILIALSNFTCVYPMYQAFMNEDTITLCAITFVSLASIFSHLVENHKHGMVCTSEMGISKQTSYLLNRCDVLGCVLVVARFLQLYYNKYGFALNIIFDNKLIYLMYLIPMIFSLISEHDKYNAKLRKIYIVTHSIWHITIFITMGSFLARFIY